MNIVEARMRLDAGATRTLIVCPGCTLADGRGTPFSSKVMIRSGKAPTRSPSCSATMYSLTNNKVVAAASVRTTLPMSRPSTGSQE
jgi:hypothetical protein